MTDLRGCLGVKIVRTQVIGCGRVEEVLHKYNSLVSGFGTWVDVAATEVRNAGGGAGLGRWWQGRSVEFIFG